MDGRDGNYPLSTNNYPLKKTVKAGDPRETRVYQDCLRLYIEQGGEDVTGIERQMREVLGHREFNRRILYCRGGRPGWIERYGWKRKADTAARNASEPRTLTAQKAEPPALAGGSLKNSSSVPSVYEITVNTGSPEGGLAPASSAASRNSAAPGHSENFRSWLKRVSPGMNWDWRHLKLLYRYLERVTIGDCKRLMIFMPPRHGKSELVTVRYTAKRLSDDPSMNVIIGSYNQRLANRFSRKVRRVMADADALSVPSADGVVLSSSPCTAGHGSPEGGLAPASDCQAAGRNSSAPLTSGAGFARRANSLEEWETAQGGGLRAVGVGAGVTGYGASLVIIDDPVKSRAEAESKTYRERVWDWFNDDISTRLEPDGAIILIQTRWHEDDLAGRLIKEMVSGGEQWEILALPAIAEGEPEKRRKGEEEKGSEKPETASPLLDPLGRSPGEALCPERFTIEDLEKMRRKLGSYSFSALYQQRPTPLEGGLFKRKWLMNVIEKLPVGVQLVRSYDLAVSTRTTADYTASVLGGFDNRGNFYIADIMRRRLEFPEQKRFILDRMMREPRIQHGIELALHGQAIIQDLRRFAPTRSVALRGIRVETDKVTRALAWAALAEEGKLFLLRGPYLRDFIEEAASFPNTKHDDQIDAVSLAISMTSQRTRFRHAAF